MIAAAVTVAASAAVVMCGLEAMGARRWPLHIHDPCATRLNPNQPEHCDPSYINPSQPDAMKQSRVRCQSADSDSTAPRTVLSLRSQAYSRAHKKTLLEPTIVQKSPSTPSKFISHCHQAEASLRQVPTSEGRYPEKQQICLSHKVSHN